MLVRKDQSYTVGKKNIPLTNITTTSFLVNQAHRYIPASRSINACVTRLLSFQSVPCDVTIRFLDNSNSIVADFTKRQKEGSKNLTNEKQNE